MMGFLDASKVGQSLSHLLWFILLLAVGGIIGNRADAYLMSFIPIMYKYISRNTFLCTILEILCIVCTYMIWKHLNERKNSLKLSAFDAELDMLLPKIIDTSNPQGTAQAFIRRAFNIAMQHFLIRPRKAQLFLPDSNQQYLVSTGTHGWGSQDNGTVTTFCINYTNNLNKSTVAAAFNSKEVILVHVKEKKGILESDHPSYRVSANNDFPFKGSLICIPVIFESASNNCLGGLCFDSYDIKEFDTAEAKAALSLLARHIATFLLVQRKFFLKTI